ncbi:MAG: hypothetical protein IJN04_03510 [Clostridia bacterium]|nr:hypothetical protein [Clostridia bacterium]
MNKWRLFSSVFQIVVGIAAIIAYVVIAVSGEALGKWTITLILAIAFLIKGVIGIVDWKKSKKQ